MPSKDDRLVDQQTAPSENPFERGSRLVVVIAKCVVVIGISVIGYLLYFGADSVGHPFRLTAVPQRLAPAPIAARQRTMPVSAARNTENHQDSCRLVDTKPVEITRKPVYRWIDENGVRHFADKAPNDSSANAQLDRIIERKLAFSVEVKNLHAAVPAFLQDRISQSAARIYEFLEEPLPPEDIRKSEITINLIGDRKVFLNAYGLLSRGQTAPSGFYTTRTNEAYVHAAGRPDDIQAVAIHEASHLILTTLYQRTPLWLNEGLAEYFEVLPTSAINPAYQPKPEWIRALRRNGMMPFESLFGITSDQWRSMPPEVSYANAWAVVYFLMQSDQGRLALKSILKSIKDNPCQPISGSELLHARYSGGLDGLRVDMSRWLRKF